MVNPFSFREALVNFPSNKQARGHQVGLLFLLLSVMCVGRYGYNFEGFVGLQRPTQLKDPRSLAACKQCQPTML